MYKNRKKKESTVKQKRNKNQQRKMSRNNKE